MELFCGWTFGHCDIVALYFEFDVVFVRGGQLHEDNHDPRVPCSTSRCMKSASFNCLTFTRQTGSSSYDSCHFQFIHNLASESTCFLPRPSSIVYRSSPFVLCPWPDRPVLLDLGGWARRLRNQPRTVPSSIPFLHHAWQGWPSTLAVSLQPTWQSGADWLLAFLASCLLATTRAIDVLSPLSHP